MTLIMGLMNALTINERKIKIIVFEFFAFFLSQNCII